MSAVGSAYNNELPSTAPKGPLAAGHPLVSVVVLDRVLEQPKEKTHRDIESKFSPTQASSQILWF